MISKPKVLLDRLKYLIMLKGYIYELDGGIKTKIQFPKEDKQELALVQHYLVFQIFLPIGTAFSIEITVTDTAKVNNFVMIN